MLEHPLHPSIPISSHSTHFEGASASRMARQIVTLKEVTDEKDLWKIAVRIADLWTVFNKKSKQQHIEMIFLDAKGDKIQAVLPTDEMQTWKTILKEQNTYVFENFFVFKNDFQFKACDHPYKLVFSGGTIGTEKNLPIFLQLHTSLKILLT